MYVRSEQIPAGVDCDFCGEKPATVGCLSQGATGRVCEVMWGCTSCTTETPRDAQATRELINSGRSGFGKNAYSDF